VELVDLETISGYVDGLHELLKEGLLVERRAFIRSFVEKVRVTGDSLKFERIQREEQRELSLLSDAISYVERLDKYQRDEFFYPLLRDFFDSPLVYVESILWKLQVDILGLKQTHKEISSDIAGIKEKLVSRFSASLS
ncbi:unnamed protein product, partial [marine sediment metagenome]